MEEAMTAKMTIQNVRAKLIALWRALWRKKI